MMIDIVGNGKSKKLYRDRGNYVVACNIPEGIRYDCLSVIDNQPIHWMKTNKWRPDCVILCTENVIQTAKSMDLRLKPVYAKLSRMNSGLYAAEYFAKQHDRINLWGMDSLFSDDLTSEMDTKVPRRGRPDLNRWWRPHWNRIFQENSKTTFTIHLPRGHKHGFQQENVQSAEHMALDIRDHSATQS